MSAAYPLGNGYRFYLPGLMRFTAPDRSSPFGAGGVNSYAYCGGEPIDRADPSGHMPVEALVGIVSGAFSLAALALTAGPAVMTARAVAREVPDAAEGRLGTVFLDTAARAPTRTAAALLGVGLGMVSVGTGVASVALHEPAPDASSILGSISLFTGGGALAVTAMPLVSLMRSAARTGSPERLAHGMRAAVDVSEALEELRPTYLHLELGEMAAYPPPSYSDSRTQGYPPPSYGLTPDPSRDRLQSRRSFSDRHQDYVNPGVAPSQLRGHIKNVLKEKLRTTPRLLDSPHNPLGHRLLGDPSQEESSGL